MRAVIKKTIKVCGFNAGQFLEAVKAGVSSYIVKPFTAEIVEEKLQKVFAA